jgi:hypothetical protein
MPPLSGAREGRARIICLANSWKRRARCIAGIDLATGCWARPVTDSADGGVPDHVRKLRRGEPALLDILDLPLAPDGPDFGFEPENRTILPGPDILHNDDRWVALPFMRALPPPERRTLQLVETIAFTARPSRRRHSNDIVWIGTLTTTAGRELTTHITDPVLSARLNAGHRPGDRCLVTVSLSMPWRPPDRPDAEERCYKLIAGVIELDDRDALTADDLAAVPF